MQAPPSRRRFLGYAAALAAGAGGMDRAGAAAAGSLRPPAPMAPRVLTAWMRGGEQSWAGLWTPGQTPRGVALPARAHQVLVLPASAQRTVVQALVLARRPGEYILRMDPLRGKALQWHRMEEDRYLGGHAELSGNGHSFFTTETDGASGEGLVAERDLHTLQKIREFPSGGIGPHALLIEPGGTLLIANGGILNLPETGRRKLNLGRMDSNLTRLEVRSGAVLAQYRLPDPHLSLRHLAPAPDGTIAAALQAEHPDTPARQKAPALALLCGETLRVADWARSQPPPAWDGYAADVCLAAGRFWASAPHAGWLASWSVHGDPAHIQALPGAGALAAGPEGCLASGDSMALLFRDATGPFWRYRLPIAWDNHATLLLIT